MLAAQHIRSKNRVNFDDSLCAGYLARPFSKNDYFNSRYPILETMDTLETTIQANPNNCANRGHANEANPNNCANKERGFQVTLN